MTTSTQFFNSCTNGDLNTVKEIIQTKHFDLEMKSPEGWTGLIVSCFNEHLAIAKFLIAQGANVNATNQKGTSVFMYAKTPVLAHPDKTEILDLLLDAGANINHLDIHAKSVLDYVIEKEAFELADWLISKGAELGNQVDSK